MSVDWASLGVWILQGLGVVAFLLSLLGLYLQVRSGLKFKPRLTLSTAARMLEVDSPEVIDNSGRLVRASEPLFNACIVFLSVSNSRHFSGSAQDLRAIIKLGGTRYSAVFMDVGFEHQSFSLGSTNAPRTEPWDSLKEAEAYLRRLPIGVGAFPTLFPGETVLVPVLRTTENQRAVRLEVTDAPVLRPLTDRFVVDVRVEGKSEDDGRVKAEKRIVVSYRAWNRPDFMG